MNYINLYADFLKKFIKPKRAMKVVFDCSNGTVGLVLKKLFRDPKTLNAIRYTLINEKPDGRFPAHGPNPMLEGAMDDLSKAVLTNKADLGVILDAYADRVFFSDDRGEPVPPYLAAVLISGASKGPVVFDLLSGYLAKELIAADGKKFFESRVGSYFVKQLMRQEGADFGAEASGHYYFKFGSSRWDSGIRAAIEMINRASGLGCRLSDWTGRLPRYYRSGELNFSVEDKTGMLKIVEERYAGQAESISHLDGLKMEFSSPAGEWWFSLRPSNTEDLLRLNLEAKDKKVFEKLLLNLKRLLS